MINIFILAYIIITYWVSYCLTTEIFWVGQSHRWRGENMPNKILKNAIIFRIQDYSCNTDDQMVLILVYIIPSCLAHEGYMSTYTHLFFIFKTKNQNLKDKKTNKRFKQMLQDVYTFPLNHSNTFYCQQTHMRQKRIAIF